MNIIRELVKEGKSIILITHKLKEIKAVADVCTIIRRGKQIATVDVASTTEEEMATMESAPPILLMSGWMESVMLSLRLWSFHCPYSIVSERNISMG